MKIFKSRFVLVFSSLLMCGLIGFGLWFFAGDKSPIMEFDDARDTKDLLDLFARERYWLVADDDYSPEYMIKYRAPNPELMYRGRLHIKVCRVNGAFVGFTTYYMKTPELGQLLFLAVNPEFRGRTKGGYAQKLLRHGLDELKKMGAHKVLLYTRTDNMPGQGLYNRVGFYEISRDDGFIQYNYDL